MTTIKIRSNAPELAARLKEMQGRAKNPGPALKVGAALLSTLVDDTFRDSTSPAGEQWKPLAPSTLLKRALSRGGKRRAVRRSKSKGFSVGVDLGLSKKAMLNISNVKPLVDTAKGRNSIRVRARGQTITLSTNRGYMGAHLGGDTKRQPPRPPRRAWAPFLWDGSTWVFDERGKGGAWLRDLRARVRRYVLTGAVQ